MYNEFNMDSIIKIKLTLEGKYFLLNYKFLGQSVSGMDILTREDENGYIWLRFWEFIKIFGGYIQEPYKNHFFKETFFLKTERPKIKKLVYN